MDRSDLCLRKTSSSPCDPALRATVANPSDNDVFLAPHDLARAEIVHGPSGQPLLFVQAGSVRSGNGDQLIRTQVLAYRADGDRFERVHEHVTGHNNNQEVRYIATGPLKGDIVSVEPTQDAPYGFWVVVNTPANGGFKAVLRYRSATRYGDGNPLAVIELRRCRTWPSAWAYGRRANPCRCRPRLVPGHIWCAWR
ncbi:hypothetical protein ACRAWD_25425 [Caulobacter segnis]